MTQEAITKFRNELSEYNILVTGSTGFIGAKLVESLTKKGYKIKAMTRKRLEDSHNVKYVQADAFDVKQLEYALNNVKVAYYLLHSMEGGTGRWKDFASREKIQAQNFVNAAFKAGVRRIIYLGGLVNDSLELSPHMQSRKKVGEILASSNIPVTELRASLIIGARGGSYAMLRYLVERLRIMICPSWVKSLAQPIAVDDVIEYLVGCMEHNETSGKIYEIGGPDKITYEELMRIYSAYINKSLFIIQIPFLTTRLSSYWVDLVTPVKASLARPLIDSLVHDTVVTDDSIKEIIPLKLKSVLQAIDIATREMKENPPQVEEKSQLTGFKTNQKILMVALIAYALCGTTYYWLDDRPEVYQPIWISASITWYATIGLAIVFVYNKTRLGYLLAGVVSWITLIFWSFDNYHVIFSTSIISQEPNYWMTVRNFVGMLIVAVAVIASHNLFRKVIEYQYRGKPI